MIILNEAIRTRRRPNSNWMEAIKKDMLMPCVTEMVFNGTEWKKMTHVADPK